MSGDVNQPQRLGGFNPILSRFRNFHNFSSIGSFFLTSNSNTHPQNQRDHHQQQQLVATHDTQEPDTHEAWDPSFESPEYSAQHSRDEDHLFDPQSFADGLDGDTPTPTRSTTPKNNLFNQPRSFYAVKPLSEFQPKMMYHDYRGFGEQNGIQDGDEGGIALAEIDAPSVQYSILQSSVSSFNSRSISFSSSDSDDTPPLSPDDSDDSAYTLIMESLTQNLQQAIIGQERNLVPNYGQEENVHESINDREDIRNGKKPVREICYDTLIDDISGLVGPKVFSPSPSSSVSGGYYDPTPIADNDADGWYGLEYTLALSCKERRASESQCYDESESVGESSRSRESWAAIRLGKIHPFFEDEDYHQWKSWRISLDREDEKHKHHRAMDFEARSGDLSWYYLNEMRARDVMYWQQEVYGIVGREVKQRLASLAVQRRDPYFPPQKHNLGWYLKRSRSIGCLRELKPKKVPKSVGRGRGRLGRSSHKRVG
ncbi:hypothetical protein D9757_005282 [Collybiopsis confluens]|uniref:Uncharacterized protein n=1 Tax=Collybiopsis confluens TaxID=2823264 RepID=A0A8H5HW25_9AGAR|nr:hypothetical protein D9757_005282 [Collybiopsis confluens]